MNTNLRLLLRQFALIAFSVVAIYGLLLALSLWRVPLQSFNGGLDTGLAGRSLYLTEPKYVFFARHALDTPRDKVILLGASNVVVGFRQAQVQAGLPEVEVSNLGVGGSNLTQVAQIVDLVLEAQRPEAREHNTFVIGLWYGLFADDRVRWQTPDRHAGDTDIDIERYRYGLYRRAEQGPRSLLPMAWQKSGALLIHPYLVADQWLRQTTVALRGALKGKEQPLTDAQRDARVVDEAERQRYLAFWTDYMGGGDEVSADQFKRLQDLVELIVSTGGRVVLADLPLPAWHANGSPYARDYERRLARLVERYVGRDSVRVLSMPQPGVDIDFSDEVHPKPRVTKRWAQQLVGVLNHDEAGTLAVATTTD